MEYFVNDANFEMLIESQKRNVCEEIVDQLCQRRIELGVTQQEVADITGIKRPNIARIEACTTTPTFDVLVKYAMALGYKLKISLEEDECQRPGRNKETIVDTSYISSGKYRRKFDKITLNSELNRLIYQKAKEMLIHRSGTEFEDMYWIDMEKCEVICSKLDETNTKEVRHTKAIDKKLKSATNIIAIHTHPYSMPPSAEDFNTYYNAGYDMGIVLCHDGTIYRYMTINLVPVDTMNFYVNKYYNEIKDEKLAQIMMMDRFMRLGDIYYEEVNV